MAERIRLFKAVVAGVAENPAAPGVYVAPNAATDAVKMTRVEMDFSAETEEDNSINGTRFSESDIVGGMKCKLTLEWFLKGSGTPGVAPESELYFNLAGITTVATATDIASNAVTFTADNKIQAGGGILDPLTVGTVIHVSGAAATANAGEFVVTATAVGEVTVTKVSGAAAGLAAEAAGAAVTIRYGIAGTQATAGGAAQATLQAPFAATEHLYAGMPVLITGNPAAPTWAAIAAYSAARVAKLTEDFSAAPLDNTSVLSIPANILFRLISDDIPTGSVKVWKDGRSWSFRGLRASKITVTQPTGKAVKAVVELEGLFQAHADDAVPAAAFDATRPGVFRASSFTIDTKRAAVESVSFGVENETGFDADPNDVEGFSYPEVGMGTITGQINPTLVKKATRDLLTGYRSGSELLIASRVMGGQAALPGARIAVTVPRAQCSAYSHGDREGLAVEQVTYKGNGLHEAGYLAIF